MHTHPRKKKNAIPPHEPRWEGKSQIQVRWTRKKKGPSGDPSILLPGDSMARRVALGNPNRGQAIGGLRLGPWTLFDRVAQREGNGEGESLVRPVRRRRFAAKCHCGKHSVPLSCFSVPRCLVVGLSQAFHVIAFVPYRVSFPLTASHGIGECKGRRDIE